jgi:ribonuclease Y
MDSNTIIITVLSILVVLSGTFCGWFFATRSYKKGFANGMEQRRIEAEGKIGSAEAEAERIREDAKKEVALIKKEAEALKKSKLVEAKDEIHKLRVEADKEIKDRRFEITRQERRINQKEEHIDKKLENLERKDEQFNQKLKMADEKLSEADTLKKSQIDVLERISGYTKEQAKEYIINSLEGELTHEKALKISAYEQKLKDESEEKARAYIALAISKCAADQVSESAVSVIPLSNDEMKGRIIGREGRNIRTIETLTGVEIIIDDTPEAITLSCFDQVRREVARIAIEKLIADGRIHPAKIEEMVDKARREVEFTVKKEGERAIMETNVHNVNPELVRLLGRLKYRTSYRQNVLLHSVEVAHLAGTLANELGVDANLARRAGLLHDIGKSLTAEFEGTHVALGVEICKKYKESPAVLHAIEAHHGDIDPKTVIACIVQAADAISASRPGARSENYENYIKRLQRLEELAKAYDGVKECYAIQAGREIRIIVAPEVLNDEKMVITARNIAKKIESELQYPGQIRVNLIRESRAVDFAK